MAVAGAMLAIAPSAVADYQAIYQEYQQEGQIDACRHSAGSLDDARRRVPNDVEQYDPDFAAAINRALSERGRCAGGGSGPGGAGGAGGDRPGVSINAPGTPGGPGGPPSADGVLVPRPPVPPRSRFDAPATPTSASQQGGGVDPLGSPQTPAPILFLAGLTALLLAGLGLLSLGRFLGWGPGPLGTVGHGLSEGAMRVGAATGGAFDRLRGVLRR